MTAGAPTDLYHLADYLAVGLHGAKSQALSAAGPPRRLGASWPFVAETDAVGALYEAALFNGIAAHALDWDDTMLGVPTHPGSVILSAAFAASGLASASVEDLATTFRTGVVVADAIGAALGPEHYERGWHATATVGRMAAAYATSLLIDGDDDLAWRALQLAAIDCSGVADTFGTSIKPVQVGLAAASAVIATRFAGAHPDVPDVFRPDTYLGSILGVQRPLALPPIASGWPAAESSLRLKVYPCCYYSHPPIQALRRAQEMTSPTEVTSILEAGVQVTISSQARRVCNVERPQSVDEARFCIPMLLAAVALPWQDGALGLIDGSLLTSDAVNRLAKRVQIKTDPGLAPFEAELRSSELTVSVDLGANPGMSAASTVSRKLDHLPDSASSRLARSILAETQPETRHDISVTELISENGIREIL